MGLISSRDSSEELEQQPLLAQYYSHNHDGAPHLFPTAPVTELATETKYVIINALEISLSQEKLGSLEIYMALLRPIVKRYREEKRETATVYCFLLNRWQFLRNAENDLANARLNETRANACEIVATKILKTFSMRQLIDVLTYDFSPVKRNSRLYLPHFDGDPAKDPMSALEVAISGKAKYFISSPIVQEIINQIWLGEIVFFSNAIDNPETCLHASQQEIRTVTVYDSRDVRFMRLSRLRVPRYKTAYQMVSFSAFNLIYTLVTFAKEPQLTSMEVIMDIMALSFALDECIELKDSGFSFYFENVWNLFDVPIYIIFIGFIGLRVNALTNGSSEMSDFAYDFLACNAILLWPRLFAALDQYRFFGTMLIVLRQMLIDAMLFLALSFIFYVGFLQAFYALHDNTKSYGEIAWLLLQVFLGSAFLGFEHAGELSEKFGNPLMVLFVAISVLMLYTLLISIFSQSFSEVSANAKEEFLFLFSVRVMEEVKSDALYEFQPPFNLLAGIVVWPCSFIYPPKFVGKLSRILLRIFYFPELVCIYLFEILVLRKRQHTPVRPGPVGHQQAYDAVPYSSSTSGIPTVREMANNGKHGDRANRNDGDIAKAKASAVESSLEEGAIPSSSSSAPPTEANGVGAEPSCDYAPGPASSFSKQHPGQLNTRDIASTQRSEILSPHYESISRYRDANRSVPTIIRTPPMKYDIGAGGGGGVSPRFGCSVASDHLYAYDQQHQERGELARLMETRYDEMRIRMDQIEAKLDRLMNMMTTATPTTGDQNQ
ncbi:hypothetical protein BGZ65_012113 [Modicella reniformis]|uniref:Ion transport domain-containing protein n=1 Tax=Modicella reniformis TaxID=1440133 RepID=A0A9P6SNL4_9FUNG|nr:hypothetical protein BGZ65_012113 [Modicella reniformis]